jgi:hypothetical protein
MRDLGESSEPGVFFKSNSVGITRIFATSEVLAHSP